MTNSTCVTPECDRPRKSRDWCHKHYEYMRSRGELPAKPCRGCGEPLPGAKRYCSDACLPICAVDECEDLAKTRGWCTFHFTRWKITGDPAAPFTRTAYPAGLMCAFDGCRNKRRKFEHCSSHDTQRRKGLELSPLQYKSKGYICAFCGGPSGTKRGWRNVCSSRCDAGLRRHGAPLPDNYTCILCRDVFPYAVEGKRRRKSNTTMCIPCRRASLKHGYSPAQLAKRDGADCKLCDAPVDMNLIYPDLMRGSVDHIIPTSLGGSNEPENVQLAHLHCNIKKNNRVEIAA